MIRFGSIAATAIFFAVSCAFLLAAHAEQGHSDAYANASRKIAWLGENARAEHPSNHPTVLKAAEWNAYLNEGGVKLPDAVSNIRITCQMELVHGDAEVDFDRLTANRTRNNPLFAMFTGKHHVNVIAKAAASNGVATIHVQSVAFDGVEVPRIALEVFSGLYLRPKYGKAVGLDSTFALKSRIDAAVPGMDQVTVTQR